MIDNRDTVIDIFTTISTGTVPEIVGALQPLDTDECREVSTFGAGLLWGVMQQSTVPDRMIGEHRSCDDPGCPHRAAAERMLHLVGAIRADDGVRIGWAVAVADPAVARSLLVMLARFVRYATVAADNEAMAAAAPWN